MERPRCGKCGLEMTPANAKVRPELFLHDECLPEELRPAEPDTTNRFLVGVRGEVINVMGLPGSPLLTKAQALNLAAHLVAMADDKGEFAKLLEAIQGT